MILRRIKVAEVLLDDRWPRLPHIFDSLENEHGKLNYGLVKPLILRGSNDLLCLHDAGLSSIHVGI